MLSQSHFKFLSLNKHNHFKYNSNKFKGALAAVLNGQAIGNSPGPVFMQ